VATTPDETPSTLRPDGDPAAFHRGVAAGFTALVETTAPGDWDAPAPVEGWTARDVVRHLVDWLPGLLEGGAGVALASGPSVDTDPAGAWRTHTEAVQALLDDPATAGLVLRNPHLGEVPVPQALSRFYTPDVFMHTWDLATATGRPHGMDADLAAGMLAGMEPLDEVLRSSGHYGPRTPVAEDADVQTKLLAFIGRPV
jgi:uncharacterized protein (TIGR03086 family)